MINEILINITPRVVRVALLANTLLQEIYVERNSSQGLVGNIYQGKVNRILPGIQAAFVDIGLERSAFLHVSNIQNAGADVDISQLLHPGQEILVQVDKEPLGTKGARLTTQFSIPSRYLVLTPGHYENSVSQKVTDEVERQRLLSLLTPSVDGGYIFRTVAVGATAEEVTEDKKFLATLWADISAKAKQAKSGTLVYEEIPIILRVLRDLASSTIEKIRVDNEDAVKKMREFALRYMPLFAEKITYDASPRPLFDLYSVEEELQNALQRKVSLKSGGYIVFDQTEAMTTIDVNTGSFLGQNKVNDTIYQTNLEAAAVIAHQVRLRNLGGIIIIDFIDMINLKHKADLLTAFNQALAQDSAKTEISELSTLGLIQMTRKRTRESLEHILCVTCPLCQRRGLVKSLETIYYEIVRELKRTALLHAWNGFLILAAEVVVNYIVNEEPHLFAELKTELGKPIQLRVEPSYGQEYFDILPLL